METVTRDLVQLVTLNDLKVLHSDALSCFEVSLSAQSNRFKKRTLIDFHYGYYKKPIVKTPKFTPTSALGGMGEFMKAVDEENSAHNPQAVSNEGEVIETSEHPENMECVTKNLPGHYILMMEAGMPGIFVVIEEFPLLTDVKSLKKRLEKRG